MPTLTITPKPFKSSYLAIPPSPFSPQLPITPPAKNELDQTKTRPKMDLPTPPPEPLNWLWQCHLCNRCWRLGVTRRCLDDGHLFCAGTTTVKRSKRHGSKKTVRHKACASEFDYQGWKAWGVWRRDVAEQMEAAGVLQEMLNDAPQPQFTKKATRDYWGKDCWNTCDYPSECRWGKQYGVQTPVTANIPQVTVTVPSSPPAVSELQSEKKSKTSFDDILLDATSVITEEISEDMSDPIAQTTTIASPEERTKKPSMDDLLQSAKRRKRRSAGALPSPLASNPPSPTSPEDASLTSAGVLQRAFDDFELDFRKSFERATGAVAGFLNNVRNSAVLEDEKAEAFVAGLGKKRSTAGTQ